MECHYLPSTNASTPTLMPNLECSDPHLSNCKTLADGPQETVLVISEGTAARESIYKGAGQVHACLCQPSSHAARRLVGAWPSAGAGSCTPPAAPLGSASLVAFLRPRVPWLPGNLQRSIAGIPFPGAFIFWPQARLLFQLKQISNLSNKQC